MGKMEYFKELEYRLRGLPERERQNILAVYEELFQKAEANGKSVTDIVDSLGFPRVPNWDAGGTPGAAARGTGRSTGVQAGWGAGGGESRRYDPAGTGRAPAGNTGGAGSARTATGAGVSAPADPLRDPNAGFVPPTMPSTVPPLHREPGEAPQPASYRDPSLAPPPASSYRGPSFVPQPERPPHTPPPLYRDPGFVPPPPPPYRVPMGSGAKPWIAALALAFFNVVFILGPYVGLCGAFVSLWAAAAVLLLSPLLALIGTGVSHDSTILLLLLFASVGCFGAGLMLIIILQFMTKWFLKLTYKYMKFNWYIIKGA